MSRAPDGTFEECRIEAPELVIEECCTRQCRREEDRVAEIFGDAPRLLDRLLGSCEVLELI